MKSLEAIFIDRDGVLNEDSDEYITSERDIKLIKDAAKSIQALNQLDVPVIIISNQSGIGRGLFSATEARLMFDAVIRKLDERDAFITEFYYCPHLPKERCHCRKPETGLFEQAAKEYELNLKNTLFIGDNISDWEAAQRVNIPFYLVNTGKGELTKKTLNERNIQIDSQSLFKISELIIKEYA